MSKQKFWKQLALFVIALIAILTSREYFSNQLIENGVFAYQTHTFLNIGANLVLILVSYYLIKQNGLTKIAGLEANKIEKVYLLVFPLLYLVLLNVLVMDDINIDLLLPNILILSLHCISIGVAEELSIRGFLQSHLINQFGTSKKNIMISVMVSALFFGLIHIMRFDKGIYGEISQICFATFIGVMFGFLLLITKRIYPLIIIHAIVDFVAKLDKTGVPIKEKISESMSIENALFIAILSLPCFVYGIYCIKKHPYTTLS